MIEKKKGHNYSLSFTQGKTDETVHRRGQTRAGLSNHDGRRDSTLLGNLFQRNSWKIQTRCTRCPGERNRGESKLSRGLPALNFKKLFARVSTVETYRAWLPDLGKGNRQGVL